MKLNLKQLTSKKLSRELSNLLGLYLLGALVLAVVMWLFLIKPTWTSAKSTKAEVAVTQQKITDLEELENATEELRENYTVVRDRRDQILNLLPAREEEEKILLLLNDYAKQSGTLLGTFAPEGAFLDAAEFSGFETYPLSINISGTYKSVTKFIALLEQGARFVDIKALSFSGGQTASSAIEAQVSVDAYYQTGDSDGR